MHWYKVQFSDDQVLRNLPAKHQTTFANVGKKWLGDDVAIFGMGIDYAGETSHYYTPRTAELMITWLRFVGAQPSEPPPPNAILLVGEQATLEKFRENVL